MIPFKGYVLYWGGLVDGALTLMDRGKKGLVLLCIWYFLLGVLFPPPRRLIKYVLGSVSVFTCRSIYEYELFYVYVYIVCVCVYVYT